MKKDQHLNSLCQVIHVQHLLDGVAESASSWDHERHQSQEGDDLFVTGKNRVNKT